MFPMFHVHIVFDCYLCFLCQFCYFFLSFVRLCFLDFLVVFCSVINKTAFVAFYCFFVCLLFGPYFNMYPNLYNLA